MADIYNHIATLMGSFHATKVLDIGAGNGKLGLTLRKQGYSGAYRGVDRNPKAIQKMQAKGLDTEEGDLKWLGYRRYTWAAVVMQDVLEELDNIALLTDAISIARDWFVLTTKANLLDCISPLPQRGLSFHIDDLLSMAYICKFRLYDYHQVDNTSVLIFRRRSRR